MKKEQFYYFGVYSTLNHTYFTSIGVITSDKRREYTAVTATLKGSQHWKAEY